MTSLKEFAGLVNNLSTAPRKPISQATVVEYEDDPRMPGRTAIRISGPTREHVQQHIDLATEAVARKGGFSNFIGPSRIAGGYGALGEVLLHRVREPAE